MAAAVRTHAALMAAVRAEAGQLGLAAQHFPNVTGAWSTGWPDLVIAGPGGIIWREVKTARGRLASRQWTWGFLLLAAGADWGVWTPADWPENIKEQLTQLAKV